MASKTCCLRQHVRNKPTNLTFLDLSLDDNLLEYLIRGPNLVESHIQEDFELLRVHETKYESGSMAILRWRQSLHTGSVEAS